MKQPWRLPPTTHMFPLNTRRGNSWQCLVTSAARAYAGYWDIGGCAKIADCVKYSGDAQTIWARPVATVVLV